MPNDEGFDGQMRAPGEGQNPTVPQTSKFASVNRLSPRIVSKVYVFAAIVLFWVSLSTSLLRVQLAASPVYRLRVPAYRSMPIRPTVIAQVQGAPITTRYN